MGKSGCSLPDFSKRLREATFFVAFRSRGSFVCGRFAEILLTRCRGPVPLARVQESSGCQYQLRSWQPNRYLFHGESGLLQQGLVERAIVEREKSY